MQVQHWLQWVRQAGYCVSGHGEQDVTVENTGARPLQHCPYARRTEYIAVVPEPRVLWEPVLLRDDDEGVIHQAGAFPTEAEAQMVLDVWRAEGRRDLMGINVVPVYDSAEEWQADR